MALVGASSLKGKEIKAVLEEGDFPVRRLALLDAEEASGQLTEFEEEPTIIQPVHRDQFENVAVAFFACSPAFTEQHWAMAAECGCDIVDVSYFLDSHPQATLRAPILGGGWETQAPPEGHPPPARLAVAAHPAAIALAGILGRLSLRSSIQRAAVTVFEPASERGHAGVDELHRQTLSLFSFQELPRNVFDAQVAFNLLSGYGENCRPPLRQAQERIADHARRLLAGHAIQPSVRLLAAPVFYGHSLCCFVELQERVPSEALDEVLNEKPFTVCRDPQALPTVVGVAGSNEIALGPVESDPACEAGYWVWGVMDSLRLGALNAVAIAQQFLATRRGVPTQ